jgi:hypothetical protein
MEEIYVLLERHDQNIQILQKQVTDLYQVQKEIRAMNETLITLANEIKHANEHLARHEEKIDEMESRLRVRLNQIAAAAVTALTSCLVSAAVSVIIANLHS